jgi:hypothetical protein
MSGSSRPSALRGFLPHLIQVIAAARKMVLKPGMLLVSRFKGAPMISHAHRNLTEPASGGFDRVAGYALVALIAVLILVALMTNPVLLQ